MEIQGKVIDILNLQRGNGRNGEWKKQDFIVETQDQYPKKICISMWGDKIDQFSLKPGEMVTVGVNIESREYNGKWYTDIKAWKVDKQGGAPAGNIPNEAPMDAPQNAFPASEEDPEDLPF